MTTPCQNIRFIASAGTGKTHQVVSLYQALLLGRPYPPDDHSLPGVTAGSIFDGGQRIPPDRILMLTFTRNAAAEMRSRVTEAIEKELAGGDPDNEAFCWSLLRRLSGATISTIHSFAQQILARHTLELGLSPTLTVLEEADAAVLRSEAAQSALRKALGSEHGPRGRGPSRHQAKKGVSPLGGTAASPSVAVYSAASYLPDLEKLCEGHGVDQISKAALQTITQCATWGIDLENATPASLVLTPAEPRLTDLTALLKPVDLKASAGGGASIKAMASGLHQEIKLLGHSPTPESVSEAAGRLVPFTQKNWGKDDDIKELRKSVQASLATLAAYSQRKEASRLLISFITLAQDCARGIHARKSEQGVLDFDDLLFRARDLIQRNPGAVPATDVIIVDEAQDNNRLQNELILLVQAASQAAVAVCGDTKQTIYSWRGADPDGLDKLGATLKLNPIPLRTSYRSQQGILDWVNDIFAGVVMGTDLYGENEELLSCPAARSSTGPAVECLFPDWEIRPSPKDQIPVPGKPSKSGEASSDARIRITITKRDIGKLAAESSTSAATDWAQVAGLSEHAQALEARAIARRIRLLTTQTRQGEWHPPRVWDSATQTWITPQGQPYRFRDILILLRATNRQSLYEQALQEENIPFTTDGAGRGFFMRQEVQDVSNLLAWLAFPLDRQSLLALLRSPFCALSDNAVAVLSSSPADPSLRGIVTAEPDAAALIANDLAVRTSPSDGTAFLRTASLLRRLCGLAGRVSAVDLVREATHLTGYDAILAGTFHGVQRLANLQKLLSWVQDLERSENLDLQATASRLASEITHGREAPDAAVLDPDDDSVRINTVHAAKGLSSPVVIVPDLRRIPRNDSSWIHVIHGDEQAPSALTARLKFYNEDDTLEEQVDAEGYAEELERNKMARNEESRRLFYVAATRARDLLIFSSENPNLNSDETWRSWINQHLLSCDFKPELVRLRPYGEIESAWLALGAPPPDQPLVTPAQLTRGPAFPAPRTGSIQYRFPVTALVRPTSPLQLVTVNVTHKAMDNRDEGPEAAPPPEHDVAPAFTKAQLGTLAHQILETLDYHSHVPLERQVSQAPGLAELTPAEQVSVIGSVTKAAVTITRLLEGVAPENLIREMPFVARFDHEETEVIVDGKVDLLYFKAGAWHILDYKFSAHTARELADRYALQLAVYRDALFKPVAHSLERIPRFDTELKRPAPLHLTLLGITPTGVCTEVDVTGTVQPDIAAQLATAARGLSRF
ncbi:MAG: UvrD-helicase domain-containing protein [bacterium]